MMRVEIQIFTNGMYQSMCTGSCGLSVLDGAVELPFIGSCVQVRRRNIMGFRSTFSDPTRSVRLSKIYASDVYFHIA